jgi:hypothetical protein
VLPFDRIASWWQPRGFQFAERIPDFGVGIEVKIFLKERVGDFIARFDAGRAQGEVQHARVKNVKSR